jgi:serine/threonine protein kinase
MGRLAPDPGGSHDVLGFRAIMSGSGKTGSPGGDDATLETTVPSQPDRRSAQLPGPGKRSEAQRIAARSEARSEAQPSEVPRPAAELGFDSDLKVGDHVGEYVVEARIGAGAFGEVYRGVHPVIGKPVAIKVLSRKLSADPVVVSRFVSEARAVNTIQHENIVDIFAFGTLGDGRHYHIMELLEGEALDEHLHRRNRLSLSEALPILEPIARALDAAHQKGIAHRDLKPGNVFLVKKPEGGFQPKLLDFGVAKLISEDVPKLHKTATGSLVGTPYFMSPEQCRGTHVDHRTDIYAFGVMAYRILAGDYPFNGESAVDVIVQHLHQPAKSPRELCPDLPHGAADAVLAMLAKEPENRPSTVSEAVRMLQSARSEALKLSTAPGIESAPPAPLVEPRLSRSSGRGRGLLLASGLAAALGAIAFSTFAMWPEDPPSLPAVPDPAPSSPAAILPKPVEPLLSPIVSLTITGAPGGARVLDASGAVIGSVSEVIDLPRTNEARELRLELEGYWPRSITIVPDKDLTIDLTMDPKPVDRTAPPKKVKKGKSPSGEDDLVPWE